MEYNEQVLEEGHPTLLKIQKRWYWFVRKVKHPDAKQVWGLPTRNVLPWAFMSLWENVEKWGTGLISAFALDETHGRLEVTFPEISRKYSFGYAFDSSHNPFFWNRTAVFRRHLTRSWELETHPPLKIKRAPGGSSMDLRLWTRYYVDVCRALQVKPWDQFWCFRFADNEQKARLLGMDPLLPSARIVWGATDPISGDIVSDLYFDPHEITHVAAKSLEGWPDPLLAEGLAETFKPPLGIDTFLTDRWIPLNIALRMLAARRIAVPELRIQMSLFVRFLLYKKGIPSFHNFYKQALPSRLNEAAYRVYSSHLSELDKEARAWVQSYGLQKVIRTFDLTVLAKRQREKE